MYRVTAKKVVTVLTVLLLSVFAVPALAQDDDSEESIYSFGGDVGLASKYIWRGQLLTNAPSLQPSVTVGIGGFSFNVWGTMDLSSVNEGDGLFIPENPDAPAGGNHNGLNGKFSEVDYTFSYAHSFEKVSIDVGTITYAFPQRAASLATTTELYLSTSLDTAPLAPSLTLYIDIDETSGSGGSTGVYFALAAGHSFAVDHPVLTGVDLSFSLGFANSGFSEFSYGASDSGAHDVNFTVSFPFAAGDNWSFAPFVSFSGLVGPFKDYQFLDPRESYLGTAGLPSDSAATVWGGVSLSLAF